MLPDRHEEEGGQVVERSDVSCADKAEVKRREIRRRLLLGGSAVVPIIITTINPRRALAASEMVCKSINPSAMDGNSDPDDSFYCDLGTGF